MRTFTLFVFVPATLVLLALALVDGARGDGRLWRAVAVGAVAGFAAACAYDVFRVPFVYAPQLGLDDVVPHLKLFKVFPRFGAMILGEPVEQASYSASAQAIGWLYHFSNGMTFGVMLMAMIGRATRRSIAWAVLLAVGLELGMLLTPYPKFFGIALTATFVAVTLSAHLIFGIALGWCVRRWDRETHALAA